MKNSRGKILEKNVKKIGFEKTSINDLEEVKSVEKCQCGKKRDKFPWKNITYLVVAEVSDYGCFYMLVLGDKCPELSLAAQEVIVCKEEILNGTRSRSTCMGCKG